jgi:hypothetical protein
MDFPGVPDTATPTPPSLDKLLRVEPLEALRIYLNRFYVYNARMRDETSTALEESLCPVDALSSRTSRRFRRMSVPPPSTGMETTTDVAPATVCDGRRAEL